MNGSRSQSMRLKHHRDQLLVARDLQADFQIEREFLWLHTVGLHNTWGIVVGLTAELLSSRRVRVAPGLAYDCRGRELILATETLIDVPTEHTRRGPILVMRYDDEDPGDFAPQLDAICFPHQVNPPRETPILAWRSEDALRLGMEVPLVRVMLTSLDLSIRQYAHPQGRPYVAMGSTDPKKIWSPWNQIGDSPQQIGWSMEVDTAEAGFVSVPHYFAWLDPHPYGSRRRPPPILLGPFTSVADTSEDGFSLVTFFASSNDGAEVEDVNRVFSESPPAVVWLGIEPELPEGLRLST